MFHTPKQWYQPRRAIGCRVLQIAGILYAGVVAFARCRGPRLHLSVPVISLGNITLGGTGKTPLVIALANELQRRGHCVAVLLRGYGGSIRNPSQVHHSHDAGMVGDEALECLRSLPDAQIWVGRNRYLSGCAAIAAGATLILLDDGLQHWRLARDLDITVLDRAHGLGNGLVFPAGPLREPAHHLSRADLLVLTGSASDPVPILPWISSKHSFLLNTWITPTPDLKARLLFAFSGIGLPCKFFAALDKAGLRVIGWRSFPDHHNYASWQLERLWRDAAILNATLVTTMKDWVRLSSYWQERILAVQLNVDQETVSEITTVVLDRIEEIANV